MIKKISMLLAVFIFSFSVLSLSISKVAAKVPVVNKPGQGVSVVTLTPTPKPEIDYYLPYPGILPDHPLYSLKAVRDRIWLWLTTDLVRKAQLMTLFADKRLGAGRVLIEGNKISLGLSTLEKGEKYLERAVGQLEEAKKAGKDIKEVGGGLSLALQKHEEVLTRLGDKLIGEEKAALEKLLDYPKNLYQKVQVLLKE